MFSPPELVQRNYLNQITFPAGMAGYPETLDIAINKLVKDHLRMKINEYILKTEWWEIINVIFKNHIP